MRTIIIGGVAAGMSVAAKLKREKPDETVVVYEKTNEVSYGACGLPYFVSNENDDVNKLRIRSVAQFEKAGIEVYINHEVVAVDFDKKEIKIKHGEEIKTDHYDRLVITTGASPIVPPFEGAHHENVYQLKTIADGEALKAAAMGADSVAIIGGGYIGIEVAEAFVTLGKQVKIIERLDHVLATFDEEFSIMVEDHLKENKVELFLSQGVTKISEVDNKMLITTDQNEIKADIVVMAVGVSPNTRFLDKDKLNMLRNGAIITNEKMETNIKDVYAAGDCATIIHAISKKDVYVPLGTNANKQGKVLAENLAGANKSFSQGLGSAMIKVINLELAKTGLSEKEAQDLNLDVIVNTITSYDRAGYYPNPTDVTIKVVVDKKSRVLLGAQLIGEKNVALRLNPFVVAIDQQMSVDRFSLLDFGYAPPFASTWDVMHIATSTIK